MLPETVTTPFWVIVPTLSTVKSPPTVTVPSARLFASSMTTLFEPVLLKLTAPPKSLAKSRVMALAPDVKLEVPVTAKTPLSVIDPPPVTLRFPLTVDAPSAMAFVSTRVMLLPLVNITVPKLLLEVSKVILLVAPDARVVVPETVIVPVSVIGPFEVRDISPVTEVTANARDPSVVRMRLPPAVVALLVIAKV